LSGVGLLVVALASAAALGAGILFGPHAARAPRLRDRVVLGAFAVAVLVRLTLGWPAVVWLLLLWASFGIGGRIRRRLERGLRRAGD
jgi:hypothetical protein